MLLQNCHWVAILKAACFILLFILSTIQFHPITININPLKKKRLGYFRTYLSRISFSTAFWHYVRKSIIPFCSTVFLITFANIWIFLSVMHWLWEMLFSKKALSFKLLLFPLSFIAGWDKLPNYEPQFCQLVMVKLTDYLLIPLLNDTDIKSLKLLKTLHK